MKKRLLIAILIGILALVLRLPNLGQFMTVDEEAWMLRSAEFYDALSGEKPLRDTFQTTHPGVTTMWLIGAGTTIQEQRLGFDLTSDNLLHFRKAATAPLVLASAILVGLIAWLLWPVFGVGTAVVAGLLLAADPYLIGSNQIAHLDGLQALLMLASLLAFFRVLSSKQFTIHYSLIAGIFAGLAFGVKLFTAVWLLPIFLLILVWHYKKNWQQVVRKFFFVFGLSVVTLFITWPALWILDDVDRSFKRDANYVINQEHVALDETSDAINPNSFYLRTWLGRIPPHVQLLSLGAILLLIIQARRRTSFNSKIFILFVYALGFLLLITLAAKKADRYALPALAVFPVLAGWAAAKVFEIKKIKRLVWFGLAALIIISALLVQYPIAYNNPLFPNVRPLSQQGWGEGLEQAAAWLNAHPFNDDVAVSSWYSQVMHTYFLGKTFRLSSRDDGRTGFIVTYKNMGGRGPDTQATTVVEEYADKKPIEIFKVNNVPYVWLYDVLQPQHFKKTIGELVPGNNVGQTVKLAEDSWGEIEIGFANFSSRNNSHDIVLNIYSDSKATDLLRSVVVNASQIGDNEWQKFKFETIENAKDKEFYIQLSSPASIAGNAVTVRYTDEDVRSGEMLWRGKARTGDIAYRLP